MNVIVKTSRFLDMFFLAGVASVFLVSCSGGSGGSASAPVQITESDAETDSSEIGIFDNTDTDPTIDDTAGLSTEDQQLVSDDNDSLSIQTDHPLALLFGTNEFAYRFFLDENSTFFLDVTFENIILPTEPTEGILIGIATSRTQLDGSDEILMQDGELILSCSYSTTEQYLCIGLFESGATVNFLIPNLVNGEASGNFEFCGADGQTDCVSELVLSPDGVVVLNNISTTQPLAFFKEGGEISAKYSTVVSSDYLDALLQYEEQGTNRYDRSASDISTIETSTINTLRYENSKMTGDARIINR